MPVFQVCAFDENLTIRKNITLAPKSTKILKQLLGYLKKKITYNKLSEPTKDIVYIMEDEIVYLFTCSLLFIGIDKNVISENIGISVDSIELFQEILFRVDKFRGKISKIGFFKKLIVSDNLKYQNLGVTLKAAYTFGEDYIKWKFGLNETKINSESIVKNTFKDMYYKYLERSYKTTDETISNHIKDGKLIISAAVDIQRASTMNSSSSADDIKKYLIQLQEETQNSDWNAAVEVVDIEEYNNTKDKNGE